VNAGAVVKNKRRPRLYPDEVMASHTVRTTKAQWEKFERLGGAAWLRKKIDAAK